MVFVTLIMPEYDGESFLKTKTKKSKRKWNRNERIVLWQLLLLYAYIRKINLLLEGGDGVIKHSSLKQHDMSFKIMRSFLLEQKDHSHSANIQDHSLFSEQKDHSVSSTSFKIIHFFFQNRRITQLTAHVIQDHSVNSKMSCTGKTWSFYLM